jgi:Zn-dependent protease
LIHGAELARIARDAEFAERESDRTTALSHWRRAVVLLPEATVQRKTIEARMSALSAAIDGRARKAGKENTKTGAAVGAGASAIGLALLKSKAILALALGNAKLLLLGLLKLPTLLSMFVYLNFTSNAVGGAAMAFGVLASIYVHEIGHVSALRRYGIEATAPMFIPGFGAVVRMKQYPTDVHEEARTGLAGPLWGFFAASVAFLVGCAFDLPVARAVASLGATINLFNLIPVWQLDGARGMRALSRAERLILGVSALASSLIFRQYMPLIVGIIVLAQAFSSTAHKPGDRGMFALYAAIVPLLAALASLPVPGISKLPFPPWL